MMGTCAYRKCLVLYQKRGAESKREKGLQGVANFDAGALDGAHPGVPCTRTSLLPANNPSLL